MLGRLALEDDVVDAGLMEHLSQQQACRAGTDDGNLSSHGSAQEMELGRA
jgi:hypothetical protein